MKLLLLLPREHGIIDYVAGVVLITVPFVLGFRSVSDMALWLSVCTGCLLVMYSGLTDYALSISRTIPFRFHLLLDLTVALILFAAPLVFEWNGIAAAYYFIMAAAVIVSAVLTSTNDVRYH